LLRERITNVNSSTGEEVKYEYDSLGRESKLTYPDGTSVTYSYDDLNRMIAAVESNGNKTTYSYDAASRLIETDLPNGEKVMHTYNAADQVVKLENISKAGKLLSSFQYTYDNQGNIIKEVRRNSDDYEDPTNTSSDIDEEFTRTYTYDGANEVTGFTEQGDDGDLKKYDYSFDKAGNRISVQTTGGDAKNTIYSHFMLFLAWLQMVLFHFLHSICQKVSKDHLRRAYIT
jgi:YD repeat-containing protein